MSKSIKGVKVIGLGQACFDCLGQAPCYPEEDSKVELNNIEMQCGGPVASALTVLSRFGIPTSFLGSISNDFFGKEIYKSLINENIDTSFLKITPGYTSQFAFISTNQQNGNRNIFWKRSTAPFLAPDEVNLSLFPDAEYLHLDGLMVDASIEAARQAEKLNIKVVIDAGTLRDGSLELLPFADILITSQKFAEAVSDSNSPHEAVLESLKDLSGADTVIYTRGSKGSVGLTNGEIHIQPAFKVNAIDTTGAGDVYHGAYIFGLLKGWNMAECMSFASAVSAEKCRYTGIKNAIFVLENIKKYVDMH